MARERDEDFTDEPRRRRRRDDDDEGSSEDRPRSRRRDEEDEEDRPRRRRRDDEEDYDEAPRARRRRDYDEDEEDDRPRRRRDSRPRKSPADLRTIAWSQKIIILCILVEVLIFVFRAVLSFVVPPELALVTGLVLLGLYLLVGITATVCVFIMALKVYSPVVGVLLALLTLIPCIGLIVLIIINTTATGIMQQHGIRVGLLGANMADLR
jgi:hypothetical protein